MICMHLAAGGGYLVISFSVCHLLGLMKEETRESSAQGSAVCI